MVVEVAREGAGGATVAGSAGRAGGQEPVRALPQSLQLLALDRVEAREAAGLVV
jgi:hypothetical protein